MNADSAVSRIHGSIHAFARSVANHILNEVRGINLITYDVTSKPPSTIEWE